MKDWSIILVRNDNKNDTFVNRLLYWIIWNGSRSQYNHCQIVREFNNTLYICESTIAGFVITKTLDKWLEEQEYINRVYKIVDLEATEIKYLELRFNEILGNKYNARYWFYLICFFENWLNKNFKISKQNTWRGNCNIRSTNCFQSVAYILGQKNWFRATGENFN